MSQYAERNLIELDQAGNFYGRHVLAMTVEGLHSKSDIAAELAYRDLEIDRLRAELYAWKQMGQSLHASGLRVVDVPNAPGNKPPTSGD